MDQGPKHHGAARGCRGPFGLVVDQNRGVMYERAGSSFGTQAKGPHMKSRSGSVEFLCGSIFALSLALVDLAQAQQAQSIFIEGDMVRGNTGKGQTGPTCVLNSQFKHNENAVFRVRVRDITGKPLDDKEIKGVVIELSDGQKLPMRYGGHPPRGSIDYFWSAGWVIPDDYPTGSLYYKVVATDLQGRVQTWQSFQDPRSQLEVVAGTVQYSGIPQAPR